MKLEELGKEFALVGATVIDGTGEAPKKDMTIIVKEVDYQVFPEREALRRIAHGKEASRYGIISEIGSRDTVRLGKDVQQVDVSGQFVMPGLMDCHIHLFGEETDIQPLMVTTPVYLEAIRAGVESQIFLDWGFTTVRDCGSAFSIYVKKAVEEGTVIGPRILSSHRGITRTGGEGDLRGDLYEVPSEFRDSRETWYHQFPCWERADGVEEIRKVVRRHLHLGVDCIKTWVSGGGYWYRDSDLDVTWTIEELKTMVNEANRYHVPVAAHCTNTEAVKMAVEAGVGTIEHAYLREGELDEETLKMMVRKNIFLVPTLSSYFAGKYGEMASVEITGSPNAVKVWKSAIKAGVKIAMGSDPWSNMITPYGVYAMEEMRLEVDILGITPMEVIVAATKTASEALGIQDKVGTIERGKVADLLIVKENPVENISVLENKENILHVIKEGKLVR